MIDYGVYSNGHLKSAVQKFVRRGMAEEAAATAVALARRGQPLFKRLPVIAAEDVGWEFVAPVFRACRELGETGLFERTSEQVLPAVAKLARALAQAPKDRDCIGLMGLGALANERAPVSPAMPDLRAAIEKKDELLAMRHCERFVAGRQRRLVWDLFRLMASEKGGAIEAHVEAIRGESYLGVLQGDELILMAAAIFAMTGSKEERAFPWAAADGAVSEPRDWLPWYVFDMHTKEGAEAKAQLAREGEDVARINDLWWFWESSLTENEVGRLARRERLERGYVDWAEWGFLRGRVRSLVEESLRRTGLPSSS